MTTAPEAEQEKADNYEQAINATLTFIHIYKWNSEDGKIDAEIKHWIGKEYKPNNVTPDITLQFTSEAGLVVELKESLPNNNPEEDRLKGKFEQLASYDTQLENWDTHTRKVNTQELVLLVDQKFTRKVMDYIKEKGLQFNNFSQNFCVVQYSPASGLKDAVFLRAEYGKLSDYSNVKYKELEHGIPVALEYLLKSGLSTVKFLDYPPPPSYLMNILWQNVFPTLILPKQWMEFNASNRRILEIEANVSDLRNRLANNFVDHNSKHTIKENWIKKALDIFVQLKYAQKINEKNYLIKYKTEQVNFITEVKGLELKTS